MYQWRHLEMKSCHHHQDVVVYADFDDNWKTFQFQMQSHTPLLGFNYSKTNPQQLKKN